MKDQHFFTSKLKVTPDNPSGSDHGNYVTAEHDVSFGGRAELGCVSYGYRVRSGRGFAHHGGRIYPENFADLALSMMAAKPEAAIKAFATAMQQFELAKAATFRTEIEVFNANQDARNAEAEAA